MCPSSQRTVSHAAAMVTVTALTTHPLKARPTCAHLTTVADGEKTVHGSWGLTVLPGELRSTSSPFPRLPAPHAYSTTKATCTGATAFLAGLLYVVPSLVAQKCSSTSKHRGKAGFQSETKLS